MAFRGWLGPVFAYEWLTATRRWQMYAGRAAFVGLLLVGLVFVWANGFHNGAGLTTYREQAEIGRTFFQTLVSIEVVMIMLTAPAAAAGAICLDKARGTLLHVLVTDLSDSEIVLGKLEARLAPMLGLVACSLPVLAVATLLGGIDPVALTGSFLVIVGVTVLGCALALTISVWGKKTHEVLLATYGVLTVWVVVIPAAFLVNRFTRFPGWLLKTNPIGLTIATTDPSRPSSPGVGDQLLFLAAALLISAALLALAVARLRPAIIHQWGRPEQSNSARVRRRYGYGPTLDGNPVLWREWHRRRPSRWARIIWGLYIALAAGFTAAAVVMAWQGGRQRDPAGAISGFVASIGLLLLSVSAATSLAEERAMGSLDVLLATPLPTSTIVWGKWWGTYRTVPLLAILPGMVAVAMAHSTGRWLGPPLVVGVILAYGAAVTSLGLALATWVGRLSLALALCVGAVVGVTVGAIPVAMILFRGAGNLAPCAAMASPFFGVGYFSAMMGEPRSNNYEPAVASAMLWSVFYATAAGGLLAATLSTFDRGLGRLPDRPAPPRLRPPPKVRGEPTRVVAEEF